MGICSQLYPERFNINSFLVVKLSNPVLSEKLKRESYVRMLNAKAAITNSVFTTMDKLMQ